MYWKDLLFNQLLAAERIGVVSDFDGTLSQIVDDRDQAEILPENRDLLVELQQALPLVAVVSGRSVQDLYTRMKLPGIVYIGNHGLERWVDGHVELAPMARPYRPALETIMQILELAPGMEVDDKGASISIHYRNAENPEQIRYRYQSQLQALVNEHGLELSSGRMVFELRPPVAIDKGTALEILAEEYELDGVIYLGDDTTDIDAFKAARRLREAGTCYALSLGIESLEMPPGIADHSDALVSGPPDVAIFFSWLLEVIARKAS